MDIIICDISAFMYWRTPPLVRLLASAPEDDDLLRNTVEPGRLRAMRDELAEESLLWGSARGMRLRRAHYGAAADSLRRAAAVLAPGRDAPVDVLVTSPASRRRSALVRPRVWPGPPEAGGLARAGEGVVVVSPELALQQLAARASLMRTVLLASELCGSFSVYVPPGPVRALLQELADAGRVPKVMGWSPSLDPGGRITSLWSRPALTTPARLGELARASAVPRGRARLNEAASLVVPGAASPFEVRAGALLGLPAERGGEGHAGLSHNHRVGLSSRARAIARRASCYCDLFWDGDGARRPLDVECQSALSHLGESSALSDADRSAALQLMGLEVINVTYGQISDPRRFEALAELVAERLGEGRPPRDDAFLRRREALRAELFASWERLPEV